MSHLLSQSVFIINYVIAAAHANKGDLKLDFAISYAHSRNKLQADLSAHGTKRPCVIIT